MIKAIIFDLDDTLFDCTGTLVEAARKRAASAMKDAGFPGTEKEIFNEINTVSEEKGAKADVFGMMCRSEGLDERHTDKIVEAALNAYNSDVIDSRIRFFEDVPSTLESLRKSHTLALVTSGSYARQKKKIETLGASKYFDVVHIDSEEEGKTKSDYFCQVLEKYRLRPEEAVCVGDRVASEIKAGNRLGMVTVQMMHGRHKDVKPKSDLEEPDYRITRISEIPEMIRAAGSDKRKSCDLSIVCIGGGTGMPTVLEGLKRYNRNLTAVVGVTDSGRSSGMLRKDMGILPPGDIRNCLIALSESEKLLHDLFQYRFKNGSLHGHSLGNLLIAALSDITGNFEKAVNEVSKILNIKGTVLPTSLEDTHLCAEREDGEILEEEDKITQRFSSERPNNPIKRIFLKEETPSNPRAIKALEKADYIVIGPGSLYVSVLNNLLHKEVRDAINNNAHAKKIYVCNIVTQPYQTDGFSASDHVDELLKYLRGGLDHVLFNNRMPEKRILQKYEKDNAFLVKNDTDRIRAKGIVVLEADLMEEVHEKRLLYAKRDLLRHDPEKIAGQILRIIQET